ncbi:MAG: methyltransferase [Enhygromyxa sp.]
MARRPPGRHEARHRGPGANAADADPADSGRPEGLNPDDPGVRMLSRAVAEVDPEALLLVHCGDLPGLRAGATRLILDVRERTGCGSSTCIADLGGGRGLRDGAEGQFSAAVVWPRAHLGKDFSEECLATAALGLREGGRLYCAVRKQKGGKSLGRTMRALLGDAAVEVGARDRGYHLWIGERGPDFDLELATELTTRRYELRDPALGELTLYSRPGVFSRRELDGGTRALLAVADAVLERDFEEAPKRVVDLCAGIGPLGLWAAARSSATRVLAVESNLRACALLRENAAANGLSDRVSVCEHDGLPDPDAALARPFAGRTELALLNPPTHADPDTLLRLLDFRRWLAPGGRLLLVVNRPGRAVELLTQLGAEIEGGERDGYFVLGARWPLTSN